MPRLRALVLTIGLTGALANPLWVGPALASPVAQASTRPGGATQVQNQDDRWSRSKPDPLTLSLADLLAYAQWLEQKSGQMSAISVLYLALKNPSTRLQSSDLSTLKNQIALYYRKKVEADHHSEPYLLAQPRLDQARAWIQAGRYAESEPLLKTLLAECEKRKAAGQSVSNVMSEILLLQGSLALKRGEYLTATQLNGAAISKAENHNHPELFAAMMLAMGRTAMLNENDTSAESYADMALEALDNSLNSAGMADALQLKSELYLSWGKADQAQSYLTQAVKLAEENHNPSLQILYVLMAQSCVSQNQRPQARQWLQQADALFASQSDVFLRNLAHLQFARVLMRLEETGQALQHFETARAGFQQLKLNYYASQAEFGLSTLYQGQKQYRQALALAQQMLQTAANLHENPFKGNYYSLLGQLQVQLGEPGQAIQSLEKALQFSPNQANPRALRENQQQKLAIYQALYRASLSLKDLPGAFQYLEASKAAVFLDEMKAWNDNLYLSKYEKEQSSSDIRVYLPADTAAISYAQFDDNTLAQFAVQKQGVKAQLSDLSQQLPQQSLYQKYAPKLQLEVNHKADFGRLCQVYHELLSQPGSDLQTVNDLGALLYQLLIEPQAELLRGKRHLLILPDGVLGLIPFETLRDARGHYLVETWDVQYSQSFNVLYTLGARQYPAGRKSLLALGNADYQPQTYALEPIESEAELLNLKQRVWSFPDESMHEIYGALYAPQWSALPGSQQEIQMLSHLMPGTTLRQGQAVNEADIKALSHAGELAQYQILHWAVHGLAVPEIPELSALVLSQTQNPQAQSPQTQDNYLRMPEIAQLKLKADLVNLSACETGLGKIFRGEGVVGLTQAFLSAGANRVAVSLWQINDQATARFMQSFYGGLAGSQPDYRASLNQTKRQFIAGKFGKALQHPAYWSPFVMYGRL